MSRDLAEATGTIRWHRSDSDECICCVGKHVYRHDVVTLDGEHLDIVRWFYDGLRALPEGATVRVALLAESTPAAPGEEGLDAKIANRLVTAYCADRVRIAAVCDEIIDPSGNLLGWLRALASQDKA